MLQTLLVGALAGFTVAVPGAVPAAVPDHLEATVSLQERAANPYAPSPATCPSTSLIRTASGLNPAESSYVAARYTQASASYNTWLSSLKAGFTAPSKAPVIAAAYSGGGFHAATIHVGVRQAFDSRESNVSVGGLLQAFTYESGLSGGSWFLGSVAGNDWPTSSFLRDNFYIPSLGNGLLFPGGVFFTGGNYYNILVNQVASKFNAGYEITIVDVYARLIGYATLAPPDGGVSNLWSDRVNSANWTAHNVPFPIITARGINNTNSSCSQLSSNNISQFEITPVEFGAWGSGIKAFTPTKYLGTRLSNGKPTGNCTVGFDNLSFIQGTSGNIFAGTLCSATGGASDDILNAVRNFTNVVQNITGPTNPADIAGANYPNPFYQYTGVSKDFASSSELSLVDGATGGQNDPIWPFLNRKIDVLFVSDVEDNNTSGIDQMYNTYTAAKAAGLTRMPAIPAPSTWANGTQPYFFGCNNVNATTIIWLPATGWTCPNTQRSNELQASRDQVLCQINNGYALANYNGTAGWSTCVACATLKKTGATLPSACTACFKKYCYN